MDKRPQVVQVQSCREWKVVSGRWGRCRCNEEQAQEVGSQDGE